MRQALIDISGKLDCLLIEVLQNRKQIEELDKSKIGVKKYTICCAFGFVYTLDFDVQYLCCILYIKKISLSTHSVVRR